MLMVTIIQIGSNLQHAAIHKRHHQQQHQGQRAGEGAEAAATHEAVMTRPTTSPGGTASRFKEHAAGAYIS